jgi:metallo-beta-lactamase family protein
MRIQFCGADRTVTGSCHLLEIAGVRVLLDCGMFQGAREQARRLNGWLPDDAIRADAVILTHGHLDHCGKLPVLVRAGYVGPIYCTHATFDVARIVLEDAAEIQEEDAHYLNQRARDPSEPPVQPLYRRVDAHNVLRQLKRLRYGERTEIRGASGSSIRFTFYDAGHILGSAYVVIDYQDEGREQRLLFTGDIGRYGSPIVRDPTPPPAGTVDHLITESTYGDRAHAPMDRVAPQLLDALKTCVARRGRMICPAFAVGRTQIILHLVQRFVHEKQIPTIPIYIDSPMGVEVSEVHRRFRELYDHETRQLIGEEDLFGLSHVKFASSSQQSREINRDRGPCVIIASSPTCEFGRVLHHLKHTVEDPNDLIVFTGWIPPDTLGRRLQDGQKRVRIYDRWYEVKCEISTIHGLSAHADADELIRFLRPALSERTTAYIVHGEVVQAEGLARRLLQAGVGAALIPAMETDVITSANVARIRAAPVQAGNVRTDGD